MFLKKISSLVSRYSERSLWRRFQVVYKHLAYQIERNGTSRVADVHYFIESPEYLDLTGVDYNKPVGLIFATFDRPCTSASQTWYNITECYALCDKFCTMPKQLKSSSGRLNRALLLRTDKAFTSGHKIRQSIKKSEFIDIVELNGRIDDVRDLYEKYEYALIIENCQNDGYVSEKFFDAVKSGCKIIYLGGYKWLEKNGFEVSAFITHENINELDGLIQQLEIQKGDEYTHTNFKRLVQLRENIKLRYLSAPAYFNMINDI